MAVQYAKFDCLLLLLLVSSLSYVLLLLLFQLELSIEHHIAQQQQQFQQVEIFLCFLFRELFDYSFHSAYTTTSSTSITSTSMLIYKKNFKLYRFIHSINNYNSTSYRMDTNELLHELFKYMHQCEYSYTINSFGFVDIRRKYK